MLSPPPSFKSHGRAYLAHHDKAQGVLFPTPVEPWISLSHKFHILKMDSTGSFDTSTQQSCLKEGPARGSKMST